MYAEYLLTHVRLQGVRDCVGAQCVLHATVRRAVATLASASGANITASLKCHLFVGGGGDESVTNHLLSL